MLVLVELLDGSYGCETGVVDENVDGAESCDRSIDGGVDLSTVGDVQRDGQAALRRGSNEIVERLGTARGCHHAVPRVQGSNGERSTKTL